MTEQYFPYIYELPAPCRIGVIPQGEQDRLLDRRSKEVGMRISKHKLNPSLEKELSRLLFQTISDLKEPKDIEAFFRDILSKSEMTAVTKRLAVIYWLSNKRSYDNIKENLKVSSATIASIDRLRKRGNGVKVALKYIEADKWAEDWAEKIQGVIGRRG